MSKCRFCDFKVLEKGNDEYGDYLEGERMKIGEGEVYLCKLEYGHCAAQLCIEIESDWEEAVKFDVGGFKGSVKVPTGINIFEMLDVSFCPKCGREL